MRALRFGKSFPIERYLRFSDFVHRIELPEWFEIEDQNEAYALAEASLDFHDATIIRADQTEDDMEILFSCWGCYITVRFLHILDANIVGQAGLILDSEIKVEADGIRWTITDGYSGWTDGVDYDRICEHAYIKCKRIRWKLEGKSNPVL